MLALQVGNVTALAYLRNKGGTQFRSCLFKARRVLLWVEERHSTPFEVCSRGVECSGGRSVSEGLDLTVRVDLTSVDLSCFVESLWHPSRGPVCVLEEQPPIGLLLPAPGA